MWMPQCHGYDGCSVSTLHSSYQHKLIDLNHWCHINYQSKTINYIKYSLLPCECNASLTGEVNSIRNPHNVMFCCQTMRHGSHGNISLLRPLPQFEEYKNRAQRFDPTSKLPRPQLDGESMGCARTPDSVLCQTPQDTPRGPVSTPQWIRAVLAATQYYAGGFNVVLLTGVY